MSAITPQQSLHKAQTLLDMRQYAAAEAEARRALAADPNLRGGHSILALALSQQEKHQAACEEAAAEIRLAPTWYYGFYTLGNVKLKMRAMVDAKTALNEAIRLDPYFVESYARLADLLRMETAFEESIAVARKGLAINPQNLGCLLILAESLGETRQFSEALAAAETALQLAPDSALAHGITASILMKKGQHKRASEIFREALRLDPTSAFEQEMLIQTMKGRNPLYAMLLRSVYLLTALPHPLGRNLVITWFVSGIIITGMAVLVGVIESAPAFFVPLLIGYLFVAFWVFAAGPLFDLTLILDRFGRMILSPQRKRGALLIGIVVAIALVLGLIGFSSPEPTRSKGIIAALQTAGIVIPLSTLVSGRLTARSRRQVIVLILALAVLTLFGVIYTGFRYLTIYHNPGYLYYLIILCGYSAFGFAGLERVRRGK